MEQEKLVDANTLNEGEVSQETLNPEPTNVEKVVEESRPAKEEREDVEKLRELVRNYKIRAEKAEQALKELSQKETPPTLSVKDIAALVKNNVAEDDYEEVFDYARLKKISVSEALKSPIIQAILKEREEARKSAALAAIGDKTQRPSTPSPSELLRKAEIHGELPEDDDSIQALVEERLKNRTVAE